MRTLVVVSQLLIGVVTIAGLFVILGSMAGISTPSSHFSLYWASLLLPPVLLVAGAILFALPSTRRIGFFVTACGSAGLTCIGVYLLWGLFEDQMKRPFDLGLVTTVVMIFVTILVSDFMSYKMNELTH
jgi:hypothetical protein